MGSRPGWPFAVMLVVLPSCVPPPRAKPDLRPEFHGVDPASGRRLSLSPLPAPAVVDLSGVWVSPQLGVITLHQDGSKVDGKYQATRDDCQLAGELLHAKTEGNLVRFDWIDQRGGCGRAGTSKGTGYFLSSRDDSGSRLYGRRWLDGGDESREEIWTATLRAATTPDVDGGVPPVGSLCAAGSAATGDGGTKVDAP
jgi:hypothetical protein